MGQHPLHWVIPSHAWILEFLISYQNSRKSGEAFVSGLIFSKRFMTAPFLKQASPSACKHCRKTSLTSNGPTNFLVAKIWVMYPFCAWWTSQCKLSIATNKQWKTVMGSWQDCDGSMNFVSKKAFYFFGAQWENGLYCLHTRLKLTSYLCRSCS